MADFPADVELVSGIPAVPTILDVIARTIGMGFVAVARVTEERWIACSVLDRIEFGLTPGGELKVETTVCHEVRQSREPVIIENVAEDDVWCKHPTPAMYGFQSYISMPIILEDGSFFGTLCAIDPLPVRLNTPEVIGMFRLFAELIASHLNARRQLSAAETHLTEERTISELREQFIAILGHDLRNPLSAISTGIEILRRSALDERCTHIVAMMKDSAARMASLIDDVTDFARGRLGSGIDLTRNTDAPVEPVLREVIAELAAGGTTKAVEPTFAITAPVNCDRARIAQLLSNLLANALTYGAGDQPVQVRAFTEGGVFEISVANKGEPIPPATLSQLFRPFHRGMGRPSRQGLGLGLFIANQIAISHGGTLGVVSTQEETRFIFRMPIG